MSKVHRSTHETQQRAHGLDGRLRRTVREHFEKLPDQRKEAAARLRTAYYDDLYSFVRRQIPPGSRVLDLGCGDGSLLASLRPSFGVGVDISQSLVERAQKDHPELHFVCADVEQLPIRGSFDYVIGTNLVGFLVDVWAFLGKLTNVVSASTRVILTGYNFLWEPVLKVAQAVGLKRKEPLQNWISLRDMENILQLGNFERVAAGYRTVIPVGPLRLVRVLNRILSVIPGIRKLGITSYVIARPNERYNTPRTTTEPAVSVICCVRNERGNIRPVVERMAMMGSHTEIVFVDGDSNDGTPEEIEAVMRDLPHRDVKLIHQGAARGKGDALRMGMDAAGGDILMVFDPDLTIAPEELEKFYQAIITEQGEFINGTRLVYPMEKESMRLANIAGNKAFSLVFSWILDQRITDTLCANKVLWAKDYEKLKANRDAFGDFDPFGDFDLLFGAANLGLKIKEVPVRYRARSYGSTKISRWRHGVLLLRMSLIGARRLRLR